MSIRLYLCVICVTWVMLVFTPLTLLGLAKY